MKIEKLNENKLKVIFSSKELEENNISIHSFLANSKESRKFFLAILNIANEDLNFRLNTSQITYDTISFSNKYFVIIIKKVHADAPISSNNVFYKFNNIDDLFEFCDTIKNALSSIEFDSTLYQYDCDTNKNSSVYFLKFDFSNLDISSINKILAVISEFKNFIKFSKLALSHFEEFSTAIIKNSAIQSL